MCRTILVLYVDISDNNTVDGRNYHSLVEFQFFCGDVNVHYLGGHGPFFGPFGQRL